MWYNVQGHYCLLQLTVWSNVQGHYYLWQLTMWYNVQGHYCLLQITVWSNVQWHYCLWQLTMWCKVQGQNFLYKFLYCCSILHYITQHYMLDLLLFTVIWLFILAVSYSWIFWLLPYEFSLYFLKSIDLANVVNCFIYFFTNSHFRTGQSSSLDV